MSAPVASSSNQPAPATQPPGLDISESLLDALPGQIAVLDRSGTIRFVNQAWQDFAVADAYVGAGFGVGGDYPRLCTAAGGTDGPAIAHGVQTLLALKAPPFAHEYACRIAGKERWFRLTATASGDDSAPGVVIMHLDITTSVVRNIAEQKRIEAALRRSEAQFRAMCDTSPVGIFLTEPDGYSIYANVANLKQMGLTAETAMGAGWQRAIHPEDRERVFAGFAMAIQQGIVYEGVNRYLHANGTVIWVNVKATAIRDETTLLGFVGMAEDITEHKRAEESLRESEERFRQLAENISMVFWLTSRADDSILYVSPAYERIWGRAPDDLYADPYAYFETIHPDDRESAWEVFARNNDSGYDIEYRIVRPDGSIAWIHDHGFPIRDRDGHIYRVAGIATDITERKGLEEALLQSQKMEGIGRLAGGIAHDFNNLLTAIVGYAEFAEASLPPEDPIAADIEQIIRAANRAAELTSQLLAFARKQMIEPRVLNLNNLVLSMDKLLRRLIGEDVELITRPAPDLGLVKVDPGQFEQILINLAVNARDAMPNGGRLTIETRNVLLGADDTRQYPEVIPGPHVLLAISDTGIGMNEVTRAHIFEPFFTTKERGKGTGLGLATCYGIVKQAGGHIWISSEPERGATFKIFLPHIEAEATPVTSRAGTALPRRGDETILLVEDEPLVRDLAVQVLRAHGYAVLVAGSGGAALALARAHSGTIDLLVTDVVMPQMSGTQVAQQLSATRPGVKVLYISGYTESATVHHDVLEQGSAFLAKPFTPSVLAHKVREVLDSRKGV
jgi:two-component system, cell cycle sensor histidine kinase and response regulator CckA